MSTTPTELVQQIYAAFGQGDIAGIAERLSSDVVWTLHTPNPPVGPGGKWEGTEGVLAFFVQVGQCEEIMEFVVSYLVSEGNRVVARGHETTLVRATSKTYVSAWTHCWTVVEGKVTEWEGFYDSAAQVRAYTP